MYTLSLRAHRKHHISPDLSLSLNNSPLEMIDQVDQVKKLIARLGKQIATVHII